MKSCLSFWFEMPQAKQRRSKGEACEALRSKGMNPYFRAEKLLACLIDCPFLFLSRGTSDRGD